MGFPRQEHWSGLPFPPPGDLPDPGIKHTSLVSPALDSKLLMKKDYQEILKYEEMKFYISDLLANNPAWWKGERE